MVVGLHVIHAVPEVKSVLESLHRVLVPGGSLLVVELDGSDWEHTPGSLWTDMVFGGFSEWFGYTDGGIIRRSLRTVGSVSPDQ
jgi:ubiquinone/menaquinone biosynthesis C-methylase UbiE